MTKCMSYREGEIDSPFSHKESIQINKIRLTHRPTQQRTEMIYDSFHSKIKLPFFIA